MSKKSGVAKKAPSKKQAASKKSPAGGCEKTTPGETDTAATTVGDPVFGEWSSEINGKLELRFLLTEIPGNRLKARVRHNGSHTPAEVFEGIATNLPDNGVVTFIRRDSNDHLIAYCGILTVGAGTEDDPHIIEGKALRSRTDLKRGQAVLDDGDWTATRPPIGALLTSETQAKGGNNKTKKAGGK